MSDSEQNNDQEQNEENLTPVPDNEEMDKESLSPDIPAPEPAKPPVRRSLFRKFVNAGISIFLGFVLLTVLFVGFSQTKTFRELLREKVMNLVNEEINGKLYIEKIDGTILTSLFLHNVSVVMDKDTLLYARNIEIKTSPLQLLLKKIFARKILLEDVKIKMLQDRSGDWNFSKLIKPTPEDTTKSSFSFMIQANDIQFKNISFTRQSYSNLNSLNVYSQLNPDDLRIENINFIAQAYADLENSDYLLIVNELSLKPNLSRFNLKYMSGEIAVTQRFASISNFYFLSDSSEIKINARLDSLNLFGNDKLADFRNYPIMIEAKSKSFNFDDISSIIGSTEMLKGHPAMELKARGKFGNFSIDKFTVDYRNTHIEMEGRVQNLNLPEKLFITAKISNTDINYKDINSLLPTLELPEYAKLRLTNVNMEFEGEPTNFKSRFAGNVDDGNLILDATMDLSAVPMTYNIAFQTTSLNLYPILNITTKLDSKGTLVGKGVSPNEITADLNLNASGSKFDGFDIDKFSVFSHAVDGIINLDIDASSDKLSAQVKGDISFDRDTIPSYNLVGRLNNLNLSKFLKDEKYESNFNIYLSADGKNFNPDEMTAIFKAGIDSSRFRGERISNSDIQCILTKDSTSRQILIKSDFADLNINGNFSINKAIDLVVYESATIADIIAAKIQELNPLAIVQTQTLSDSNVVPVPSFADDNIKFNFECSFKDLELISKLIGYEKFDLAGDCKGYIKNESGNFSVSAELYLDYFVMMQMQSTIYLSGFKTDMNFTRDNHSLSFDRLFGTASITGKRFYSGSNIKSIEADIVFNQSKLFFNSSANIADMFDARAEGIILMTPLEQKLLIDKFSFLYRGINWINTDTMKVLFNPNYFKVAQFNLKQDTTFLSLSGIIESSGKQDLMFSARGISGEILERYAFGLNDNKLIVNGSLDARIFGELENPIIDMTVDVSKIKLPTTKPGNFIGTMHYSDKIMTTNLAFLDSTSNRMKPLFSLSGNLPVDLSFGSEGERFLENDPINIKIKSTDFNLNSFGDIFPFITNQSGNFSSDIEIGGTFRQPSYSGYVHLKNAAFKMRFNNLNYACGIKLRFDKQSMNVDSMIVSNAGGTKNSGQIYGSGGIKFDGFQTREIKLLFTGDLAVLGQQTKAVSPLFYGDLLIGTDGDWLLSKNGDRVFFKGNILMKNTDLTYTTGQENTGVSNNNFNFIFVKDSSKIDLELERFEQILSKEKDLQNYKEEIEKPLNFDYDIGIRTENSANAVVILSQAVNQKLFVEMRGSMKYSNISGETRAQGIFELLPGSKLEFIKTFEAAGFLRFERDITNPYLDIVATYTDDYINPRDEKGSSEPVAVKIRIRSPLSDLGKSLAGNNESIGVYVGSKNIQNNSRDTRYDYADAFSFIFIGKFKDDLTAQDKTNVAGQSNLIGNTASSFLGTILSSFVNSAVGDLVNNISINQTGYSTKISLSGRTQNFRYTFGGATDSFLNFGKANIKFEWSPLGPSFLIRLERKEPIVSSFGSEEKISELALKYKFEF